jgi:hypothetical protein
MATPALWGGLVMGVLSALPIVAAGNLCCCLWVISGGLVAAYFLQQQQVTPITNGDGALVGLLVGIVGVFVVFVFSIPITLFLAAPERQFVQRLLENSGSMPPEFRDMLERYASGDIRVTLAARVIRLVVQFVVLLCLGAIFSTLGGLIGALVFRKPPPPLPATPSSAPPTIDVPPST